MQFGERQRLLALLDGESDGGHGAGHVSPRLTVVCAPIGYGKTSLLSTWLSRTHLPAAQTVWVHCPPRRPHIAAVPGLPQRTPFWQGCAESIAEALGVPLPQGPATFETVYRLASRLRTPHTLIIDDYHRDTSAITDYEIAELATLNVPLHILVLARRLCVLDGPLVAGRDGVQLITASDLALNEEETDELLRVSGVPRTTAIDSFLASVNGWPLAVTAALAGPRGTAISPSPGSPIVQEHTQEPPANEFTPDLGRFVLHQVEVMSEAAKDLLMSAALLDSTSLELSRDFARLEFDAAAVALSELIERGMVVDATEHTPSERPSPHGLSEFRCHAALRPHLLPLALRAFDDADRTRMQVRRAAELAATDPFRAFELFCKAEAYAEAEAVLTESFGLLMCKKQALTPALRRIPRSALLAHPAFVSARLFLETDDPSVPPATIQRLSVLLSRGVTAQLAQHAESLGYWSADATQTFSGTEDLPEEAAVALLRSVPLPVLAQAVASARLLGDLQRAHALANKLELRLSATPMSDTGVAAVIPPHQASDAHISSAALLVYLHEIALTATEIGSLAQARRVWARMQTTAIEWVSPPRQGFTSAAHPSEQALNVGQRWLLAAFQGRALTEAAEGNFALTTQLLEHADQLERRVGLGSPGLCWVTGAIARYAVAAEAAIRAEPSPELVRLALIKDRIEPWALYLTADATFVQREHGAQWALERLETSLKQHDCGHANASEWRVRLASLHAQLCTVLGNFTAARRVLEQMPAHHVSTHIEEARLALFSGDELQAIVITAGIGDAEATVRQRADRSLIRASACWLLGQHEEASVAFTSALQALEASGLQSPLWGVPFDTLQAIAVELQRDESAEASLDRRETGLAVLERLPQNTRTVRFEKLTEMELHTLRTLADHNTISATAQALFVTLSTVKKHLNAVYRKLRVRNRSEAMLQASRMGLIQTGRPTDQRLDAPF